MLSRSALEKILSDHLSIATETVQEYVTAAEESGKSLEDYLVSEEKIKEKDLYQAVAAFYGVPFVSLKEKEIPKDILELIPAPLAETHGIVAYEKNDKELFLVMLDPGDIQTIEFIHRKTGLFPVVSTTTPSEVKEALHAYHSDIGKEIGVSSGIVKEGDLKKVAEDVSIVNVVNTILEHSVFQKASDIHIEPTEKEVSVRYRIDGVLVQAMSLPAFVKNGIVARIKILANLKIDEHMVPQDGRFTTILDKERFSFRVSIIPVYDGEKIVMRLLREGQKPLTLDQLGFLDKPRAVIAEALEKPHGMLLVTGPTGSGKTTTLYSMLGMLNEPGVNICTVEDPIEYHVKGVNQSQINPRVGFTFAAGLRSLLRQDPDIIMVGEIRDQETAEIAIHAAMTGHLVLSTLHTNDAPTTIPRLLDMEIPPFLVAFTVNVVIAQRLVRRICEYCKEPRELDKKGLAEIKKLIDVARLETLVHEQTTTTEKQPPLTFFRGKGCAQCGESGYKGRVGIYEVLEVTPEMQQKITARASVKEITDLAKEQGMITMLEDGLAKAVMGITTIEEVVGATKE